MSLRVQDALRRGAEQLLAAGIGGAARDARLLMARCLDIDPGRVTLHLPDPLSPAQEAAFSHMITRRAARVPVSHLLGYRAFYGRRFTVTPDVLDPRPDTEILIETALSAPFGDVLDLGTGSGAILVTLLAERPSATGIGADLSDAALQIAQANARDHGVTDRCDLIRSDWFDAVTGRFDLIVSNPPYIAADEMPGLAPELAHEPRMALTDDHDGLDAYRAITSGAGAYLRSGGRLVMEIGHRQGPDVSDLCARAGFRAIRVIPDLDGRDRVVTCIWQ